MVSQTASSLSACVTSRPLTLLCVHLMRHFNLFVIVSVLKLKKLLRSGRRSSLHESKLRRVNVFVSKHWTPVALRQMPAEPPAEPGEPPTAVRLSADRLVHMALSQSSAAPATIRVRGRSTETPQSPDLSSEEGQVTVFS